MASREFKVTGRERFFDDDQIIVSKTDLKGRITYANDVFLDIADYVEDEVIGQPHSLIRHPDMPRAVFKLMWDRLRDGDEVFAYVKNRAKNGDHYWVVAHVTPSRDAEGRVVGYHSNRRPPNRKALEGVIIPLYARLREYERGADAKAGLADSYRHLMITVEQAERDYDATIFALERA